MEVERQRGLWKGAAPTAPLLLQTTRRGYSNRAKLGPEQGTKQPIPPTRPTRLIRPWTFWGSTYKNAPFGFCGCSHKVDNKTYN